MAKDHGSDRKELSKIGLGFLYLWSSKVDRGNWRGVRVDVDVGDPWIEHHRVTPTEVFLEPSSCPLRADFDGVAIAVVEKSSKVVLVAQSRTYWACSDGKACNIWECVVAEDRFQRNRNLTSLGLDQNYLQAIFMRINDKAVGVSWTETVRSLPTEKSCRVREGMYGALRARRLFARFAAMGVMGARDCHQLTQSTKNCSPATFGEKKMRSAVERGKESRRRFVRVPRYSGGFWFGLHSGESN